MRLNITNISNTNKVSPLRNMRMAGMGNRAPKLVQRPAHTVLVSQLGEGEESNFLNNGLAVHTVACARWNCGDGWYTVKRAVPLPQAVNNFVKHALPSGPSQLTQRTQTERQSRTSPETESTALYLASSTSVRIRCACPRYSVSVSKAGIKFCNHHCYSKKKMRT